jgi:hypothetical protein
MLTRQVAVLRAAHSELEELIPLSSWDAVWTQADHDGLSNGIGRVSRQLAASCMMRFRLLQRLRKRPEQKYETRYLKRH